MLPVRLNMLPPDKQRHLQKTIMTQFVKNTAEVAFFLACLVAIAFLGGQWVLETYFSDITQNTLSVAPPPTETTVQINRVNTRVRNLALVQREYIQWTPILADIAAAIPESVVLDEVSIDSKTGVMTIAGTAATRDDLLLVEAQLEAVPFIGAITIPPSQLTQRENVSFRFTPTFSL